MLSASGKWHVRPGGRWAARHLGALPWTVRTLPEAGQSALVSAGPGRARGEGGTCFGGSTALCRFLRRVGGVRLQVYISDPSTHFRGRLSLVVEGTPSPAWPVVLLRAFPGMPRPLGSCLLYLAHPISSLAAPAFPTLDLPSWFSASLFWDWATPRTLTTSLSPSDSA